MTACYVPGCKHYAEHKTCKFFHFPVDEKKKKRWIKLIRRADREPSVHSRICSCHFPKGDKELGPSIFPWNATKLFNLSFPEIKTTRSPKVQIVEEPKSVVNPPVRIVEEPKPVHLIIPVQTGGMPKMVHHIPSVQIVEKPKMVHHIPSVQIVEKPKMVHHIPSVRIIEKPKMVHHMSSVRIVEKPKMVHHITPARTVEKPTIVFHDTPVRIVEESKIVYHDTPLRILGGPESVCDKETQTINSLLLECEITLLKSELESLKAENSRLKKLPFSFASIQHNDSLIKYYTGINGKAFNFICEMVSQTELKYFHGWKPANMNLPDQILLALMKLRLNPDNIDLEVRFNVGKTTVGNIVLTFIHVLRDLLFDSGVENIPYQEENVSHFLNSYSNSEGRRIMVDCAEFCCEVANYRDEQEGTSSTHKPNNASILKGIVGIASNGSITYASKLCSDSSADRNITRTCDVVEMFRPGDFISTAKKFLQNGPPNASLNVPSASSNQQSTSSEPAETKKRVRARMHLEKTTRRLRMFHIFQSIPRTFHKYSSTIFQVCVALTNYESLIGEVSETSNLNSTDNSVLENDVPSHDQDILCY